MLSAADTSFCAFSALVIFLLLAGDGPGTDCSVAGGTMGDIQMTVQLMVQGLTAQLLEGLWVTFR